MLSEIGQSLKDNYCMLPSQEVPRRVKLMGTERKTVAARGWGQGRWGVAVKWIQNFSFAR